MATTRKPATRKPAKKRATRKASPKAVPETPVEEIPKDYDPQWHATVQAYVTLRDAGAEIPESIKKPVEDWLAVEEEQARVEQARQAEAAAKRKKADESGPKWLRNRYHTDFVVTLRSRDKDRKTRVELKPRGQRGDIFPLESGDEKDTSLISSLASGFVEIIGQTEAAEIVEKQTTNIQRTHTPLAILRNERGEAGVKGSDGVEPGMKLTVEQEWNKQGVTVAHILKNDRGETNPRDPFGALRRGPQEQVANAQFIPTGGNPAIVSSGFQPADDNAKAAIADDLARRAKGAGVGRPEQALGLNVTVEPTQKT